MKTVEASAWMRHHHPREDRERRIASLFAPRFSDEELRARVGLRRSPVAERSVLGRALREARLEKGISQASLARALDIHPGMVSRAELGTRPVPEWILSRLARRLGVRRE